MNGHRRHGRYHQLLASLPHLPHFDRLKALPIGRERFEERLAPLDPADAAVLAWLRSALWPERTSLRFSGQVPLSLPNPARTLAERAATIRAAFSARRGEADVTALERERLGAVWDSADRLTSPHGFGLDAVLRAVVRWDVATAWLAGDPAGSQERIDVLVGTLTKDWRAEPETRHDKS